MHVTELRTDINPEIYLCMYVYAYACVYIDRYITGFQLQNQLERRSNRHIIEALGYPS